MKFLNHNLFTGDITVNGTTTLSTATGITRATGDNSTHLATTEFVKAQGYATTAALSGYVPTTRTITINGTTLDLSANRSWTISEADTLATVTGRGASTSTAVTFSGGASISVLSLNSATTSTEASLYLGAHGTVEGGQLVLQKGTSQTYAAHLDNYSDQFRVLYGTNTGSSGSALIINLATRQLVLPAYTSTSSFTGTVAGYLAFDSAGNIITTAGAGSGVTSIVAGTGVTVSSGTGNVTVSIGQSVATSATPSFDQVFLTNNGNGTNVKIGDDAWIGDVNVVNSLRIMGQQNNADGYIIFGNSNTTALGRSGTGNLTYGGSTVWTASTLTNLNQLTNGPGYITSAALANYVPTSRTLTINGTSYDLSADRTWTISTVDYTSRLQHQVKAGVAINKGQAVYVTSADGTNMIVGLASNASEATSSKTMGLLDATVAQNGFANVVTEGLLAGLNTVGATAGDPVWLGTGGNLIYGLLNKPYAPAHLVFIGIVTRVNANNGEIFVKVQNGFELNEIHDVDLKTVVPVNGHILGFDGTLWVNKTIATWLGYTPANASGTTNYLPKFTGTTTLGNSQIFDNGTNVGIGTASPTQLLHITGTNAANNGITIQNTNASGNSQVRFLNTSGTERAAITYVNSADAVYFYLAAAGNILNLVGANVGIGTTSPDSKLQITSTGSNVFRMVRSQNNFGFEATATSSGGYGLYDYQASSYDIYFKAGTVGIGTTSPTNKLQVANGNMSITTGYSFILADTDTNWRLGRNIITETGNQLTASTMQFIAANAANEGWQFVDDDGNTRFEIGASTGNAWLPSGNLYLNGNLAWHAGNDGASSGLDADLLDGQHASAFAAASHTHDDRYYTETESDARFLQGTTNPGTPGNFTLSIGNNGTYSYVQSHSSQPLRLNPLGNALEGPSGSTIWHSGNDGAGSGLDADTLDGLHASSFLTTETDTLASVTARGSSTTGSIFVNGLITGGFGAATTAGTLDWNDVSNARSGSGYTLLLGTATNGMGGGQYYHPISFEYSSKNGGGNMTQLAIPYTGNGIWYRYRYGGSWGSWTRVWDSGDFTSTNISNWNTAYGWGNHASQGYATQTYVNTAISNLVDAAPSTLDTLNELAAALGDDPNFATTVATSIGNKVAKAGDTMTGNLNWGATGLGLTWDMNTDGAYIKFFNTGNGDTNSRLEYATYDDGNEYHRWVISSVERMNLKAAGLTVTGNVTCTGTFTETSSRRFKENIVDLEPTAEKVEKLRPVRYNKIDSEATEIGLIAEEVAELFPEVVTYNENGQPSGVQYQRLSVILLKTIQEQNVALAALTERINKLENK